ncbi:MAG TPA: glycosyltransferase [Candidatus Acidoferrum sp.]|nr:glycosyltransferase [Candidatus Acidoferrum sp.]
MTARADSRINVLHIGKFYPPHMGGMETHLRTLCLELRKTMNVRALVANDKRRDEDSIIDGVNVSRLAIHFNIAGAPVCTTMAWKLRRASANIVHVHLPNPAGIVAVLASGYKGKLIATWHSDVVRQRRLAQIFAPIQRRFLRACNAIIATSPNYLESSHDLSSFIDRCHVIPFGIDADQFQRVDPAAMRAIRERYPGPLLLAVGRMVYYKGFEYLIRAMRDIKATLLLIGDGPLRHSLENEARALGVAKRVIFLGALTDINAYYHACDIFVLPSVTRNEAFGIVQLEAMACGKPVVNTRINSGVPFVSLDGVTGITVPPCDVEALRHAINRLLADSHLGARYGNAGRKRVDDLFSSGTMLRSTRDLYESVVAARHHVDSRRIAI